METVLSFDSKAFLPHIYLTRSNRFLFPPIRYANEDFVGQTSPGNFCRRQAATSFENGLSCYRDLGLTQDCAKLWADTSWNVSDPSGTSKLCSHTFCTHVFSFRCEPRLELTSIHCVYFFFKDCQKLFWNVCPQSDATTMGYGR